MTGLQNAPPTTPDDVRRVMGERRLEYMREHHAALRAVESRAMNLMSRPDYDNIRPRLQFVGKSDLPLWTWFRVMLSAAPWTGRPGRGVFGLCIDDVSGGVLGVFDLGGDLMMLGPRDRYIGWTQARKFRGRALRYVVNMGTCVSVAPFGRLTGGKFIAEALLSSDVGDALMHRYDDPMVAVSTTSLYGKSSQYNRLPHYRYVGETPGGGYFHVAPAGRRLLKTFARQNPEVTAARSGVGGHYNGTWDLLVASCGLLGVDFQSIASRQKRGVYVALRGPDAIPFLRGDVETFEADMPSMSETCDWWLERWYAMRLPKVREEIAAFDFNSYRLVNQMDTLTRAGSIGSDAPVDQTGEGGAIPSPALH